MGVSTGDFTRGVNSSSGSTAKGLSFSTVCRLKEDWITEYDQWRQRDLSKKNYVYFWVDGIYLKARMEDKQCILVIIGADEFGNKELIALEDGYRESEQSWMDKTGNILNKLPKSLQARAKQHIHNHMDD